MTAGQENAVTADALSTDRPDYPSDDYFGGVGRNVSFEDLHVEFWSAVRPGNDYLYSNGNHDREMAPRRHRDDALIASGGTAPVVYRQPAVIHAVFLRA